MSTTQIYHRSNMSTGSISRKRVGSMSQRGDTPLTPLDIQSIQMPSNPQNALALKTAALSSTKSLYQTCSHLRKRLRCVEDFSPFLDQPSSAEHLDVVSHMVHLFRLGSPLCHLYNLLIPTFPDAQPIPYAFPDFMQCPEGIRNWAKRHENAKQCQKYIAMFCMAMNKRQDGFGEIWALHELWGKSSGDEIEAYDSTGLMKVLHTVEAMLDRLPQSAMSPLSPATPYTPHISRYDLPFSMGGSGSGMSAIETMAATMNGGVHIGGGEAMSRGLSKSSADSNAFKSVEELVASEKSYVQELEILVRYSTECVARQIISTDANHAIFSNLSKILDFHRKFLIKLETEYEPIQEGRTWAEGRWGRPFVSSESEFDCYGPYCANYLDAISIVNEQMPNLLRGQDLPSSQRPCLHPETELQAFMIKPIQRITKYGLLLDAVLHATKKHDYAYRFELEEGAAAVRRIAASINEVTDYKAKQATVRELLDRVEDWKGHELDKFGDLWLDDHFTVTKADSPREYHVFLFDKMLLCCKEIIPERKKSTKNSSMLRKDKTASKVSIPVRKLALKGRIFVSNINRATLEDSRLTIAWTVPHRDPNGWHDEVEDMFVMTGKSDDQLKKWADKVMELANIERKRQEEIRSHSMRLSQQSQFEPRTPASETGHDGRRVQSHSISRGSFPEPRARALTEDQFGPNVSQWRAQPPMPRLMSTSSDVMPRPTRQSSRNEVDMRYAPSRGMPRDAMRSRSASQPHIHPLNTDLPPVPSWQDPASSSSTLVGRQSDKRSSGDSQSTETSESSHSPVTPYGMGSILVRVKCGADTYHVSVPLSLPFSDFYAKVHKKIRMCRGISDHFLIKWIDLDGDEVTIKCDADVEGMLDDVRDSGEPCVNIVIR
ncbi:hypothetical protein BD324DRAFT_13354 [Kockovaella imperatae]|uniref:DH domain-containing protein n=1 Tax=Kockovaella imperatae TaxID=4999 RepID=A0A1Y1UTA2_9TREE|nr:hypothetical protein BD324DRAFT_13354 [Kockovaella imperatae]ORX40656.1 hypothetical protein BD324DRAFT_13354 [Kockovaella imperatae]